MFLQEAGTLTALAPHTSTRENLRSFLCFVVQDGEGSLEYEGKTYELKQETVYLSIAGSDTVTAPEIS